jgi:hypothetical protein
VTDRVLVYYMLPGGTAFQTLSFNTTGQWLFSGKWHHLSFVQSQLEAHLLINGALVGQASVSANFELGPFTIPFVVGQRLNDSLTSGSFGLIGAMSHARFTVNVAQNPCSFASSESGVGPCVNGGVCVPGGSALRNGFSCVCPSGTSGAYCGDRIVDLLDAAQYTPVGSPAAGIADPLGGTRGVAFDGASRLDVQATAFPPQPWTAGVAVGSWIRVRSNPSFFLVAKTTADGAKRYFAVFGDVRTNRTFVFYSDVGNPALSFRQLVFTTSTPFDGNWHHVQVTYTTTPLRVHLFVDGALVGTATPVNFVDFGPDSRNWQVGQRLTSTTTSGFGLVGDLYLTRVTTSLDTNACAFAGNPCGVGETCISNTGLLGGYQCVCERGYPATAQGRCVAAAVNLLSAGTPAGSGVVAAADPFGGNSAVQFDGSGRVVLPSANVPMTPWETSGYAFGSWLQLSRKARFYLLSKSSADGNTKRYVSLFGEPSTNRVFAFLGDADVPTNPYRTVTFDVALTGVFDGAWHHVLFVQMPFNSVAGTTETRLFVDGSLVSSSVFTGRVDFGPQSEPVFVGQRADDTTVNGGSFGVQGVLHAAQLTVTLQQNVCAFASGSASVSPCMNGGACVSGTAGSLTGGFQCVCTAPFYGRLCEDTSVNLLAPAVSTPVGSPVFGVADAIGGMGAVQFSGSNRLEVQTSAVPTTPWPNGVALSTFVQTLSTANGFIVSKTSADGTSKRYLSLLSSPGSQRVILYWADALQPALAQRQLDFMVGNTTLFNGGWNHVLFVQTQTAATTVEFRLLVNGQLVAAQSLTGTLDIGPSSIPWFVGQRSATTGGSVGLNGRLFATRLSADSAQNVCNLIGVNPCGAGLRCVSGSTREGGYTCVV